MNDSFSSPKDIDVNNGFSENNDMNMDKKQVKKRKYVCPDIEIVHTDLGEHLLESSPFNNDGGHKKAGDDGEDLNAKQMFLDMEEFEE